MSHFTTIKTQIFEKNTLLEVLKKLNYEISYDKSLIGYRGQKFNVEFQMKLEGKYNIGFVKNSKAYDIVGDVYFIPNSKEIIGKIKQLYSKKIVVRNIRKLGYNLVEEKTNNNTNTIQLVMRKW